MESWDSFIAAIIIIKKIFFIFLKSKRECSYVWKGQGAYED